MFTALISRSLLSARLLGPLARLPRLVCCCYCCYCCYSPTHPLNFKVPNDTVGDLARARCEQASPCLCISRWPAADPLALPTASIFDPSEVPSHQVLPTYLRHLRNPQTRPRFSLRQTRSVLCPPSPLQVPLMVFLHGTHSHLKRAVAAKLTRA